MAGGEKGGARRRRRFLTPTVLAVIALMGFVFYATVFVFIDGWLGLGTAPGLFNAVVFSLFAVVCLWSFVVAVLTDPGRVPSSFAPETEDPQKDGLHSKYCNKCSAYKPPRTHHCRICKRCVLKMMLSGSATFMLSLAMGSLLGWHIYLSGHNLTTIEYRESVRAMWLAKKSGQKYHHPFDVGIYNNLIQILGPNVLKWLCPMALDHLKDGTQFPVTND